MPADVQGVPEGLRQFISRNCLSEAIKVVLAQGQECWISSPAVTQGGITHRTRTKLFAQLQPRCCLGSSDLNKSRRAPAFASVRVQVVTLVVFETFRKPPVGEVENRGVASGKWHINIVELVWLYFPWLHRYVFGCRVQIVRIPPRSSSHLANDMDRDTILIHIAPTRFYASVSCPRHIGLQ
jgi:hypothetical protein